MENLNERFEDEWKKAFSNVEEEPNSSLWQNLENKLAEKEILVYKQKYLYLRKIAAVLLILLIPLTIFFVYESGLKNKDAMVSFDRTPEEFSKSEKPSLNNGKIEKDLNKIKQKNNQGKFKTLENGLSPDEFAKKTNSADNGSLKQGASQGSSIGNLKEVSDQKNNVVLKNTQLNIARNKNSENTETKKKYIVLGSGKPDKNNRHSTTIFKTDDTPFSDKSNTKNELAVTSESQYSVPALNSDKYKVRRLTIKERLKQEAGISYPKDDSDSDISKEYKNIITKNSKESGTEKDFINRNEVNPQISNNAFNSILPGSTNNRYNNSLFSIIPIESKGPYFSDIKETKLYPEFDKNEITPEMLPQKDHFRRWFANIDFTPTYTNQNFERPLASSSKTSLLYNSFGMTMDPINQLEVIIKPDFSFNSGIGAGYGLNKRLNIESGVKYTYNQSIVTTNLFYVDKITSEQSLVFNRVLKDEPVQSLSVAMANDSKFYDQIPNQLSGSVSASTVKIYTQYITFPLGLSYKVIDKKINLSLGCGLATDLFLQYGSKEDKTHNVEKEEIKYYDNSIFRKVGFSLLLNAELEYEISSKYGFYLRPMYKGSLHSYTDPGKLNNRPNSTGVGFGIRYHFK